jgi:hypothetical protein
VLEEAGLVQHVVPPEPGHGAEGRATADAQLIRLFEQPFPDQVAVMALVFMHIKSQE